MERSLFVFGGTTEARQFADGFAKTAPNQPDQPWRVHIFTATEYGGDLLKDTLPRTEVHTGRLDEDGIFQALMQYKPAYVVDATHPHALEISRNLRAACNRVAADCVQTDADCPQTVAAYLRLGRAEAPQTAGLRLREFGTLEEAAGFLQTQTGNILLTTGAKELAPFARPGLRERVFLRILPAEESLRAAKALGFLPNHIIAMQGPFSTALNRALLREISGSWLVTKDSGATGGLGEKLSAAAQENVTAIIIRRPSEPDALSLDALLRTILPDAKPQEKQVYLIGVGPGGEAGMTGEALQAIRNSRCIIGAPRLIAAAARLTAGKPCHALTGGPEIIACIAQSAEPSAGVLFSGDSGFYSGAKRLIPLLREQGWGFTVFPGVSSLSYFAAKVGFSWEDAEVVSLHGRTANILGPVLYHTKTFFLTGGETGASAVCAALTDAGLGALTVHVGERLSYPDERITAGTAAVLAAQTFGSLSVVMVENPAPSAPGPSAYSLPDAAFTRGAVPMTKEEIRAVSLSKLRLEPDSVAWDVGAGTGTVACEMALKSRNGWVYAVEHNPEALSLIETNRKKLGVFNLTAVAGFAPTALDSLPPPDRVFIGGSSGQLEGILRAVLVKNPHVRVVINGITLETAATGAALLNRFGFREIDIVQISVARAEPAGKAHIMKALNPVFIITGGNRDA